MSSIGPELLSELLTSRGPALVLYARQWCDTPEDVVQEAFYQLVIVSPPPENPIAWLYRVVRNGALNAMRANARRGAHEARVARERDDWFEDVPERELDADEATAALRHLAEEQREIIVARLWGGLSFAEIGVLVGTSTSTAFRQYQSGIESLRQRLTAPCSHLTNDPTT